MSSPTKRLTVSHLQRIIYAVSKILYQHQFQQKDLSCSFTEGFESTLLFHATAEASLIYSLIDIILVHGEPLFLCLTHSVRQITPRDQPFWLVENLCKYSLPTARGQLMDWGLLKFIDSIQSWAFSRQQTWASDAGQQLEYNASKAHSS